MSVGKREEIAKILDLIQDDHLDQLTKISWASVHRHPTDASCGCLVTDILVTLMRLGYKIEKAA